MARRDDAIDGCRLGRYADAVRAGAICRRARDTAVGDHLGGSVWCRHRLGLTVAVGLMLLIWAGLIVGAAHADACPEPNDEPASACLLSGDAVVTGVLDRVGDVDAYHLDVVTADTRV